MRQAMGGGDDDRLGVAEIVMVLDYESATCSNGQNPGSELFHVIPSDDQACFCALALHDRSIQRTRSGTNTGRARSRGAVYFAFASQAPFAHVCGHPGAG
jgi:hypothetical protein